MAWRTKLLVSFSFILSLLVFLDVTMGSVSAQKYIFFLCLAFYIETLIMAVCFIAFV